MFIDTHAHLLDSRFDPDREAVIERAHAAGVHACIEIACMPNEWRPAIDLCAAHVNFYCALGVHPNEAALVTDDVWRTLETDATEPQVVAIGETGLDYHYADTPKDIQVPVFKRHLALAQRLNKPVIIHCREAYEDLFAVLDTLREPIRAVIHCFSGGTTEAARLAAHGYYLGIDGPLTYPKSQALRAVVQSTPIEQLLLETDCPYLPPQAYRGKRNEPAYLPEIVRYVADLKGLSTDEIARITTRNAVTLFQLTLNKDL